MSENFRLIPNDVIVEDELTFTLTDLCRACGASTEQVAAWVEEGVLEPTDPSADTSPQAWRFAGTSLTRALIATRLARDLDLDLSATALVLDLLRQIAALKACLTRNGLNR